jgi:hypothetical protein
MQSQYRTFASVRGTGILVERQWLAGINPDLDSHWKTIDRYNIDHLSHQPKKQADWVYEFVKLNSQEGKLYILHTPACPIWDGAGCNCEATEYRNTSFGAMASPEAFNPEIHVAGPIELVKYDGHELDSMTAAVDRCLKAANGAR